MVMLEAIIAFFAPHNCFLCGQESCVLCDSCRAYAVKAPKSTCYLCNSLTEDDKTCITCRRKSALKRVWRATRYQGVIKDLMWKYKYSRAKAVSRLFSDLINERIIATDYDLICAIPPDSKRFRVRGYNPPTLLAKRIARNKKIPMLDILGKYAHTRQVGQSATTRRKQLNKVYYIRSNTRVQDKKILIIDDVMSTGATLETVANLLKSAGAKSVEAAVVAR